MGGRSGDVHLQSCPISRRRKPSNEALTFGLMLTFFGIFVENKKAEDGRQSLYQTDLLEIHAYLMLGITASCIPFLQY